jgi:hypothetical protein
MTTASIVLSGLQKKCLKDDMDTGEDGMAITHHDDLLLIRDVVCPSQVRELCVRLVMHMPRRP